LSVQLIVQFVDPLENTVLEETSTLLVDQGNYTVKTRNPGAIRIRVKAQHWLSRSLIMDFSNNVSNLNFSLINGDIDGDNKVTVFDYGLLSDFFDKNSEQPDWKVAGPEGFSPQDCDLDGDGSVTVFDYGILSDHFGQDGE